MSAPSHRAVGHYHQHHHLVRRPRGLDIDKIEKTLDDLLIERPVPHFHHHYCAQRAQREDHANVTNFLNTTDLSPHVVGWVLKQIPEDRGLDWLLLQGSQEILRRIFDTYSGFNTFRITHDELIGLFVVLDEERSRRYKMEAADKLRRKEIQEIAQRSDQEELIVLMKEANPDTSDAVLRDIADTLSMSLSALRSKTQVEFEAKMGLMDFDATRRTIVENSYALARTAQGTRRQRVGASFTPNPYFV